MTGPFSYTGKYIARQLIAAGGQVRGFVRRPANADESKAVDCRVLQFSDRDQLARDLDGVDVLFNTYWIRFERGLATFDGAVKNIKTLAEAAASAGVRRIVHISVSNPAHDSPFAYYRGKAAAEEAVNSVGIGVSIVRPTLVFGVEDVLINNLAWLLRRMPVFPIAGGGTYRVQPVYVVDVATFAIAEAASTGSRVIDAAGPRTETFTDLIDFLRRATKSHALLLHVPIDLALMMAWPVSALLRDVMITREELGGLMAGLLISHGDPTTPTSFQDWVQSDRPPLGRDYTSELARHWSAR